MGTVHLALDLTTGGECALKRLSPQGLRASPDSIQREFELLARLRHPAIVAVHEFGVAPEGTPYYTMAYVPGVPADRAFAGRDWATLCFIAAEVAHGLEALHAAGIIHGDLKPANIIVVPASSPGANPACVCLLDFGLASLLGRDQPGHRGTPGFAAPEVVRGEAADVRADLYGLGATLYALAVGRAAFAGAPDAPALREQQREPPPAITLEEAGVPEPLVNLIVRLMAPVSAERPEDAREVRRELERLHPAARPALQARIQCERMVGRERELARLERFLARGEQATRILLVSGGSGVGKSAISMSYCSQSAPCWCRYFSY